jgi:hypothetical protein
MDPIGAEFPELLAKLRTWDDQAVPAELQQRLLREHQRCQLVDAQIKELQNERARRIRTSDDPVVPKVRQRSRLLYAAAVPASPGRGGRGLLGESPEICKFLKNWRS